MKVTYCPHCLNTTIVADSDWGHVVECEAPRCEKPFLTGAANAATDAPLVMASTLPVATSPTPVKTYGPVGPRPLDDLVLPPNEPLPRLTGAHRCQVCYHPDDPHELGILREPIGRRRWSTTHHNPQRSEPCRIDVYAAIYRCPGCLGLLETPSYQWGQEVTCPVESCQVGFIAPRDDLLHRHEGDAREGVSFVFPCPACRRHLRCDTLREGVPTTGLIVVCIHTECRQRIEIPSGGSQAARLPSIIDPIQAVQSAVQRRCSACNCLVPANAVPCPMCGHPASDVNFVV